MGRVTEVSMLRVFIAVALSLSSIASAAPAQPPPPQNHHASHHWHGYGFLPGYRTPEQIERARAARNYLPNWPNYNSYGPAWPTFYNNRWNGGGFGPCYTQTPIGPIWNCGR
jgi:hypothetical protein